MRRNVGGLYFVLSPCLFITSNCPAVLDCVLLLPTVSTRVTRPFYRIGAEIARIYLSPQNFILFLFHFILALHNVKSGISTEAHGCTPMQPPSRLGLCTVHIGLCSVQRVNGWLL